MKKYIISSLLLCSLLTVTACEKVGNTNDPKPGDDTTTEASTEGTTEEIPTVRVPDIQTSDDFEYEVIDGHTVITGYVGSSKTVEVPAELGGAPVTEIGFYAFEAEYDITSVKLPESITLIGEGAFMDCESLETINIPEAVEGIDRGAFVACLSLTEFTIPEGCEYVREEAFTACEGMTLLTIENPDLAYENWGLEELPQLMISAPEDSETAKWVSDMGKLAEADSETEAE